MSLSVQAFFHSQSHTYSYIVWDSVQLEAALIDTVLDYDPASAHSGTSSADKLLEFIRSHQLKVEWILETHAHADHLSAGAYLKSVLGAKLGIGAGICEVQKAFQQIYHLGREFAIDGRQFDHLFQDGETFMIGQHEVTVMSTPGHTNDSVTYLVDDKAFVGDTLFMPDYGTARCDFPGGSAEALYDSVKRLYQLPEETKLYLCHDYLPDQGKRELVHCVTVAEQKANNVHIDMKRSKKEFVVMRKQRDAGLDVPLLIIPAVQVNIRAGHFPPPEKNGYSYLKVPLNLFAKPITTQSE